MQFVADVHLHSRFARATSKDLNPENLYRWALIKGLTVVGTGDFTHPVWFDELQEKLEPAEEGLYRLKADLRKGVDAELPPACQGDMRFVLSVEISLIYKKNDRTRKLHHVVLMPDFDAVARLNARLGAIGNLKSDGRPILGLDSRDLVEICLEACEDVLFIPAHIWTPHFAVLGASSGFDSLEECFEDMLPHIFAVETGLSSDPPMNWRLSMLDRFAIVSNSDAHSPQKLAREATCFDTALSFRGMYEALKDRDPKRFMGTLEFYPEEGKYHYDGHRKCDVCWKPPQTLEAGGVCPVCGRKLTVGVLHRVEKLADRPEGFAPEVALPFENLIPLPEIIGSVLQVGPASKKVQTKYAQMLADLGPELKILREWPIEDIARRGDALVAEGIRRMRDGQVHIAPGYDGVYGKIQVFTEADRAKLLGQGALFALPERGDPRETKAANRMPSVDGAALEPAQVSGKLGGTAGLDPEQQAAVEANGPVVVIAGPGTGKTRVLTHRIADLIEHRGVDPGRILAVTFTNRAAGEMRARIAAQVSSRVNLDALTVGTFHRVALNLLGAYRSDRARTVVDEREARGLMREVRLETGFKISVEKAIAAISLAKANGLGPEAMTDEALRTAFVHYREKLNAYGAMDFDDILLGWLQVLKDDAEVLRRVQGRFSHVLVDEFQDVNAVQYEIARRMAGAGEGLFVIGDPDQAIYGFRGASAKYFDQLILDFPDARRVALKRTYRSFAPIVTAATRVLGGDAHRAFVPVRGDGPRLRLLSTPGETGEGIAVIEEITKMVGGADMLAANEEGHRSFDDFAVLFRTGRQAEGLEACFLEAGIPYRVVGQKGFLDAEAVQQALAFFQYVFQGGNRRLVNALALPAFHPGNQPLGAFRQKVLTTGMPEEMPDAVRDKAAALKVAAERYRGLAETLSPSLLLRHWGEEFGINHPDFSRLVQIAEGADAMAHLLDTLVLGQDADVLRSHTGGRPEAVTLMTLHASKGLEYPVVFICGVEEGLLPYREAEAEEERRLFFVGLTRGKDEVVLTHARSRMLFGQRIRPDVSRFVADIPATVLERTVLRKEVREKPAEQLPLF